MKLSIFKSGSAANLWILQRLPAASQPQELRRVRVGNCQRSHACRLRPRITAPLHSIFHLPTDRPVSSFSSMCLKQCSSSCTKRQQLSLAGAKTVAVSKERRPKMRVSSREREREREDDRCSYRLSTIGCVGQQRRKPDRLFSLRPQWPQWCSRFGPGPDGIALAVRMSSGPTSGPAGAMAAPMVASFSASSSRLSDWQAS